MTNEKKKYSCPPLQPKTVGECQPCPPRSGFLFRFCGQRKNLRGAKRLVGDVWQLPRGYVCYTPTGWVQMEVTKWVKKKPIKGKRNND